MILAKKIKEIADVVNKRKNRELRTALLGVYSDLVSGIEEKIKIAAENGLYNISMPASDLYYKINPALEQHLVADGYRLKEIIFRLACMIQERFLGCGFDVKIIGEPTNNDCYHIYIAWGKKPRKCAIGRAGRT